MTQGNMPTWTDNPMAGSTPDSSPPISQHAMPTQNPTDNITNQATNPLFGRGMDNSSGLPMDPARTASAQTSAYQRTEGVAEESVELKHHANTGSWLNKPSTWNTLDASQRKKLQGAHLVLSDPTVAADAAWLRPAIAFAHGCLLFFSIVKIIIGALWVKPYTGVVMSFFGCVGVVMAAMYTAYCYFAHRPGRGEGVVAKFFSTPTQLIVAPLVAAICIPPSAFLDGLFMHGLIRGGTADSSFPTIVFAAAHSLAQLVMLVVILVEALEVRKLLNRPHTLANKAEATV